MTQRVLTGITTTGTLHLGNYVGAIRPAIRASREPGVESYFFLADYHALIKCDDPARVARSRLTIAATWLAAGLDPERVVFYRQSDVPEITELAWLLTCVTPKGLMNRAHAYKAAADANAGHGDEVDAGITMGLFSYPILMAADILMFNAHRVPVGRDQVQHLEMTRDIAQRFNHLYGPAGGEGGPFVLPKVEVDERVAVLPGLDGRKMSKSYDNAIPLFEGGAAALRDAVGRIVTDSRVPGEAKDPEGSHLVAIHDAFADDAGRASLAADLRDGLGWGAAKARVFERLDAELAPMRARYDALMGDPQQIESALQIGARKARARAAPFLAELRAAVGLRASDGADRGNSGSGTGNSSEPEVAAAGLARDGHGHHEGPAGARAAAAPAAVAPPAVKQYREADGRFHFKLVAPDGRLLLQSDGFASGREAGAWVARLRGEGARVLGEVPARPGPGVGADELAAALARLAAD